jgi:hypothetical protein
VPQRFGPVIYWDWEWGEESHAERVQAICAGSGFEMPEGVLFYQHEMASVMEAAPRMRKRVAETGAVFVVVDSLGFARGGDANSQELTVRMFSAFRTLGVPVLAIDHVTKSKEDKTPTHSFGSAYTFNAARLMWRMDTAKEEGKNDFYCALVNTKTNRKYQKPRGLKVLVATDEDERLLTVNFETTDINDIPGLNKALSLRDQIRAVIEQNGGRLLSAADIARCMEAEGSNTNEAVVRALLNRHKDTFIRVGGGWGLLSSPASAGSNSDRP